MIKKFTSNVDNTAQRLNNDKSDSKWQPITSVKRFCRLSKLKGEKEIGYKWKVTAMTTVGHLSGPKEANCNWWEQAD